MIGKTIDYHDATMGKLGFAKETYTADDPLIVDGHGTSVIYGFEGEYKKYDPENPPPRTWGGLTIMDCQHITIRGFKIMGGINNAVSINNSYPETHECSHITIEDCEISLAETRGLFGAGNRMHDITFRRCIFKETIYSGNATHNAYMSGGSWNPEYPPISNITFESCTFAFTGGRHGLQFNGRFKGVKIIGCNFFHNQLCGISLIGVQDALISKCTFWGNGRSAIVLYDDAFDSSYWDADFHISDHQDIMTKNANEKWSHEHWVSTHHPNGNIKIEYCTMLTGPTPWIEDPWHKNDPRQFPVIQVNNGVHGKWHGGVQMNYPPGPIEIDHCILSSQKPVFIEFSNNHDALATKVTNSVVWATKGSPGISAPAGWFSMDELQKYYGAYYSGNEVRNPHVEVEPYPLIDRTVYPHYDWSKRWPDASAEKLHAGKMLDKVYGRYGVQAQGRTSS